VSAQLVAPVNVIKETSAALWSVTAGVVFVLIAASERLWRQRHRRQAGVLMIAANARAVVAAGRNLRALK
jgi:hypothetical protein